MDLLEEFEKQNMIVIHIGCKQDNTSQPCTCYLIVIIIIIILKSMGMRGHHVNFFKFVTLIQLLTIKHENPNIG